MEALALAGLSPHRVGVDAKRELRVRVAELLHDVRRVFAARDQEGGVCPSQRVGGQALGQRVAVGLGEPLIGPLDSSPEDPPAGVVAVVRPAARGAEHKCLRRDVAEARLVSCELVAQRRQQVDMAGTGVCLRACDANPSGRELDVTPSEGQRLADPEAAEHERCKESAPVPWSIDPRFPVELAGGAQ